MLPNALRKRITARALARLGVELLLVLLLLLALERWLTREAVRGPAPPLSAAAGAADPLAPLRGAPALVYFWATWCPVCRLEEGTVTALAADHGLVTVAMQSGGATDVAAHLAERGLDWPVVVDETGALSRRWGVSGVPTLFILDRHGEIRHVARGYTTGPGLRLRLWLASW